MSEKDSTEDDFGTLERIARDLPRDLEPGRDLWPEIEARLQLPEAAAASGFGWWRSPIVSAASLAVGAVAVAFALALSGTREQDAGMSVEPLRLAESTTAPVLDPGFLADRKRLQNTLEGRLEELSPEMQTLVRENLATIRGSMNVINMALAADPANAELQDLLLSAYEQELQVMSEITQMPSTSARRIEL